jgi:hypothetical protein
MLSKTARIAPRGVNSLLLPRGGYKPRAPSGARAMAGTSVFKDVAQAPPDPILVRCRWRPRPLAPRLLLPARRALRLTRLAPRARAPRAGRA